MKQKEEDISKESLKKMEMVSLNVIRTIAVAVQNGDVAASQCVSRFIFNGIIVTIISRLIPITNVSFFISFYIDDDAWKWFICLSRNAFMNVGAVLPLSLSLFR